MTTRALNVSVPVTRTPRGGFYTEVLGCELRMDVEVWPGARMIEVVPPSSNVALLPLSSDSELYTEDEQSESR